MTYYVVMDEYWNYSDTDFSVVKVYTDKKKVTKIVARANRRRERIHKLPYPDNHRYSYRVRDGLFNIHEVKGG
jgi:hypothetical protein